MSKAFTTEDGRDDEEEQDEQDTLLPAHVRNYMTPPGFARMQDELRGLTGTERPKVVEVVRWAAGNGDRSENGDYLYGKKRLREIDRRIRYLMKRLESAVVVDPRKQQGLEQVFFGATVTYARGGATHTATLVGVDETDASRDMISWTSPIATALMKAREGDTVVLRTPGGTEKLEIISIAYAGY